MLLSVVSVALCALLIELSAAGQLSNKYLPPNYGGNSGGRGSFLQRPSAARPSNQYLAPQASNLHYHGVGGNAGPVGFGGPGAGGHGGHFGGGGGGHFGGGGGGHNAAAAHIPILRNDYNNDANGNYNFGFETGNGIKRDETGEFKGGWPHGSLNVMGSYSYTGDDGRTYTVNYHADDTGFHAEGDHLPKAPTLPGHGGGAGAGTYGGHPGGRGGGGHPGGRGGGHGGYAGAGSAHSPSSRYLPPARHY